MIITSRLRGFKNKDDMIFCEAGVPIKQIARLMVDEGVEGYAGLWDLPGTVAAAVYGNAGCYGCEMSNIFHSAEILCPDGMVNTVYAKDVGFSRRSSKIKSGEIKGIILRVVLKKRRGCLEQVKANALKVHIMRLQTQPGPQNNLGSCFMSGKRTLWYRIVQKLVIIYLRIKRKDLSLSLQYELRLLGQKSLIPYLFNMNRFIWKDEKAYNLFDVYVRLYKKLYKNARLEINIFE